jgi:hypothetical protein
MTLCYPGGELELFAAATNWKRYVATLVAPYVVSPVLEVGAGIGAHVPFLFKPAIQDWCCLEPDRRLASHIADRIAHRELPAACRVVNGTLDRLDTSDLFGTVLYLDVLEHIADDRAELARATTRLADGGSLIVLAPGHQFLFSEFDRAIGHYRRYGAEALRSLAPPQCRLVCCRMLDTAGFFLSLGNRVLLRSASPSPQQIAFWDKAVVPLSRVLDRCLGYRFGKSVLAVWTKTSGPATGGSTQ